MVRLEAHDVAGGWDQAAYGPPDQVDYALYDGDERLLRTYDSVHTFLRLYECAARERTAHHAFTGFGLDERDDGLVLELHGARVRTSYADLADELAAFLETVFAALDDRPPDPGAHIDEVEANADVAFDLRDLYEDLRPDEDPRGAPR